MKILKKGITAPKGFYALGKAVGIKKNKKKDFAIVCSKKICNTVAVYTKNYVKGAPLYVTKDHLKDGKAQAVVITSGVANVCTGKKGIKDAEDITKLVGKELDIKKDNILIAQTGLIGAFTPMKKIKAGVKGIKKQLTKDSENATKAILTTDTVKKEIAVKTGNIIIGAMAKGAGMIHPNMATMLCFIFTDADFPSSKLKTMLKKAVDNSFNMLSVDMDTSTSDMVMLMANGEAGKIEEKKFQSALNFICKELAKKIATDGEGATKLIETTVKNAKTEEDAKKIAKSIVTSNLVKCMIFGKDVNWGRIMCAAGYADVPFNQEKIDIFINNIKIVSKGKGLNKNKKKIKKTLNKKKVDILVNLNKGSSKATAWGCDLTYKYVKINAHYHT